jgi:hypothetical protein
MHTLALHARSRPCASPGEYIRSTGAWLRQLRLQEALTLHQGSKGGNERCGARVQQCGACLRPANQSLSVCACCAGARAGSAPLAQRN